MRHPFSAKPLPALLRPISLLTLFALTITGVHAQRIEYGIGVGGMLYKGDLNPTFNPVYTKPAGTLFFKYNPSYATAWRTHITFGALQGDGGASPDPYVKNVQPLSFSTPIFEFGTGLEYNFF